MKDYTDMYFRTIEFKDIEKLRLMHNECRYYLTDQSFIGYFEQINWYKSLKYNKKSKRYTLCIKRDYKEIVIGMIRFDNIDSNNRNMFVGLDIIKEERGKGYSKDAYELIFQHCFKDLMMNKLTLYCAEYNKIALHLYKSLGFKQEGVLKNHLIRSYNKNGGKYKKDMYYDIIILSYFVSDYKNE